ncbi:acetyltransferase [Sphingomonas sabuli]|uniref:Acetyltransferase n=1 Tax=Sphingomonas sabuli TaxID=2764186 RepID=A0A7G9L4C0_9SPHN|nr:acetyltransferase [Sphingomonas sabuli]QNM83469.1 acetyltransferase [Sphingomonas sabuli]
MRIGIYGAGGFGRELVQPLRLAHPKADLMFIDDAATGSLCGLPICRIADMKPGDRYVLAVADGRLRQTLDKRCLEAGLVAQAVIDPRAIADPSIAGQGAVFCAYSTVTVPLRIGRQFHCNLYSYVAHDCVIGDYVTFGPRVSCNGNVHVENFAYIGTGATIRQGQAGKPRVIGEGAVVGMGAVVTKDVPPYTTVVGNPARELRCERSPTA